MLYLSASGLLFIFSVLLLLRLWNCPGEHWEVAYAVSAATLYFVHWITVKTYLIAAEDAHLLTFDVYAVTGIVYAFTMWGIYFGVRDKRAKQRIKEGLSK